MRKSQGNEQWSAPSPAADPARVERARRLERLTRRPALLIACAAAGLVLVLVAAVAIWLVTTGGTGFLPVSPTPAISAPDLKPPPSLDEVAAQYPQLADLLGDPALGSVYKEFIIAYETGGADAAKDLAERRGMLNDREEIRITLVVDDVQYVPLIVEELTGAGITVEGHYRERINVGVPLALIEQLARQQGGDALFQQLSQMEHIVRLELPLPKRIDGVLRVEGEGVALSGADTWHATGFTGQGIRIGILDLGFDGYRDLLGTELPEEVTAQSFVFGEAPDTSGEVHGTACAEIVHEMAPDAALYLAHYDGTIVSEGQAVEWLLAQQVDIVSHSAGSIMGAMDGTGEDAELVDEVVSQGVLWVNSAGNEGESHYRGTFTDIDNDGLHEFPDGEEHMMVWPYASQLTIVLNWDDWRAVQEDYDLFVYDSDGELVASAEDSQTGAAGQVPAEGLILGSLSDTLYYVAIRSYSTTRAATFDLYTLGTDIEFPVPEHSLNTPADARGALTVGATEYRDDTLASYSSQGPSNDGRLKPEMTGPAGVTGATYGPEGFDGTSASTPYVAGAAALIWSAFPTFTRDDVTTFLQTRALDLGPPGPDTGYGYGRLQLLAAPEDAAMDEAPTPLPLATAAPIATLVPEPVAIAEPIGEQAAPSDERMAGVPTAMLLGGLGVVGVCGGGVALVAAAMLLVAWRRTQAPIPEPASPLRQPVPQAHPIRLRLGILVGAEGSTPLREGPNTIGRDADCDIVLPSTLVSRRHARIECTSGECTLIDLQSSNGTFLNGRRVVQASLAPGDRLRFGDVERTYQLSGGRPGAWLVVNDERHPVIADGITIGRSAENDICLPETTVSRRHARIEWQDGAFVLLDLDSANGSSVNGQRVERRVLQDDDEIQIGQTHLRFEMGEEF
jgi:pSer/pThr/pTyr-binding forkhead associated (FHA) protein/subtilisin family serine protease